MSGEEISSNPNRSSSPSEALYWRSMAHKTRFGILLGAAGTVGAASRTAQEYIQGHEVGSDLLILPCIVALGAIAWGLSKRADDYAAALEQDESSGNSGQQG